MTIVLLILDLYFAAMLGISGIAKLENVEYFADTLRRHRILPLWSIITVSRVFPWLEILGAVLLISGFKPIETSIFTFFLFAGFLAIELILVMTKRAMECGCYGVAFPQTVDWVSLVVSLVLVALAGVHLWLEMWVSPIGIAWRVPLMLLSLLLTVLIVWKIGVRKRFLSEQRTVQMKAATVAVQK